MEAHEIPELEYVHELILVMSGAMWVFLENKQMINYWLGFISYLIMFMCIAHPICLCVVMIGELVIREQMMF